MLTHIWWGWDWDQIFSLQILWSFSIRIIGTFLFQRQKNPSVYMEISLILCLFRYCVSWVNHLCLISSLLLYETMRCQSLVITHNSSLRILIIWTGVQSSDLSITFYDYIASKCEDPNDYWRDLREDRLIVIFTTLKEIFIYSKRFPWKDLHWLES